MEEPEPDRARRPSRRLLVALGVLASIVVSTVVVVIVGWPKNERRVDRLADERILAVAPPGQSVGDAVSADEVLGRRAWLLGEDTENSVLRSYRLPDDVDARSIIIDYGRALYEDGWKGMLIVCNRDNLQVRAWKRATVRLIDSFTMSVTVSVDNGVFIEDPDTPWGPTFRSGGWGLNVSLTAPPVGGAEPVAALSARPRVRRDEGCAYDSIVGDEANLVIAGFPEASA